MTSTLPRTLDLTEDSGQRYNHMGAISELVDLLHNIKRMEPTGAPTGKGKHVRSIVFEDRN